MKIKRIDGELIVESESKTVRQLCEENKADLHEANLREAKYGTIMEVSMDDKIDVRNMEDDQLYTSIRNFLTGYKVLLYTDSMIVDLICMLDEYHNRHNIYKDGMEMIQKAAVKL